MSRETIYILCSCKDSPYDFWVSVSSVDKNTCKLFVSYRGEEYSGVYHFSFTDIQSILITIGEMLGKIVVLSAYIGYSVNTVILNNLVYIEGSISFEGDSLYYSLSCSNGISNMELESGDFGRFTTDFNFIRKKLSKMMKSHLQVGSLFGLPCEKNDLKCVFC